MRNLNAFLGKLQSGCVGSGVDYTLVDTSRPLDLLLSEYLEARSMNPTAPSVGARP